MKFNIRDYFVAQTGWKFISVDMKSMELRILAHLAKEKNMIKAFKDGIDLHRYSASMTFEKGEKDVSKEERQIAKEVSFLTVYGGTAKTLAAKRRIPIKRADKIIKNWMNAFPQVPLYMNHVNKFIKENGYAYTIFGRRRHLPNVYSHAKWIVEGALRQGLNFTVQSAASDYLVCCLIDLRNAIKEDNLKSKIVGTVHDSILVVCPPEETDDILSLIHNCTTCYPYVREKFGIEFLVPMEIEIKIGTSFGNGKEVKL